MATDESKKQRAPKILGVKIRTESDPDYPLAEMLGSFSNRPTSDFAVNHWRRQGHRDECEWFNPAAAEDRAYAERDYLDIMPFVRDRKWMMRVKASAEVQVPCGEGEVTAKVGPFYADGFDSDDDGGRQEAEKQVREELAAELKTLGFDEAKVLEAVDGAETEEG